MDLDGLQKEFGVPLKLWGNLTEVLPEPGIALPCSLSLGIGPKCPLFLQESPDAQSTLNWVKGDPR